MKTKGFIIGFTGTRNGMTTKQKESFYTGSCGIDCLYVKGEYRVT